MATKKELIEQSISLEMRIDHSGLANDSHERFEAIAALVSVEDAIERLAD